MSRPAARHPALRGAFLIGGVVLILLTPVVALLPGPFGIFSFAAGLGLVLQNSLWAKRQFARGKRRYPRAGALADRGLRRPSARRRRERDAVR
ncbi:hypothetical protein SAMN06297144_0424 [Sphingomonas guangdongensis]|uniref:Transmembrane protein (PGPGW) n=1 Tax=Sphingomonas guangdongensis TaxID=1141890 RepID=A0A285QB70_9SPHN|nr:hypothetical protein [Sphingomonas guangdongensis]SOB79195.1 hypothetical protein SAMN06297144_0424 [Sphingomonas guangdongensis]